MNAALALQDHDQSWAADIRGAIARRFQNEAPARQRGLPQYVPDNVAQLLQENAPSQRIETCAEAGQMPSPTNGRNPETREQTRDTLTERFRVHVTEPSKVAARRVGRSAETVDGYRQVGVPMAWADMVEWCRTHPGFALDVLDLMGIDIDRDRNAYATFLLLMKQARGE